MTELEAGGNDPTEGMGKVPKAIVYISVGLICAVLMPVMLWATWMRLTQWLGDPGDSNNTDLSEDIEIKRYEQGKEAAVYMDEGDALMDEVRSIYNVLDQAETALVVKLMNGQPVDVQESVEWIRTLQGKARASLEEAGLAYTRILEMPLVDDYRDYARMQKDLISLYEQLFAAQDELLATLSSAASSGQAIDGGALMESGQLKAINELTGAIDEATGLSEAFKLEKDL